MPDEETREEPEVEGHGFRPTDAAEGVPPGTPPGAHDDDSDDVEAHLFAGGVPPAAEGIPPAAE